MGQDSLVLPALHVILLLPTAMTVLKMEQHVRLVQQVSMVRTVLVVGRQFLNVMIVQMMG